MKTHVALFSIVLLLSLALSGPVPAEIPNTINYQGSLTQTDGAPLDGTVSMTFALYKELEGGGVKWSDTLDVAVSNGIYSVVLGSTPGNPIDLIFDKPFYLEVSVNGTALEPRQSLTSVPYALNAVNAESLPGVTVDKLSGRIGIGIPEPQTTLHVYKDATIERHLFLGGSLKGGSDEGMFLYSNTDTIDSRAWIGMWGKHDRRAGELALGGTYIDFRHGSTTEDWGAIGMRLTSDGKVGIGTTTPQHTLDVNGAIRTRNELIVDSDPANWPDYVFDEQYELLPLEAVADYVARHKHLPGVPTQTDIAEQGLPVGKMQAVLLEKVEELTLHTIALNAENDALQARNDDLERRLEALEAAMNLNK